MNSIKKNLSLQTSYQVINTIIPLLTAPYLARVLGAAKLGVFSYTTSVVAYFVLIAMLGTVNYGTKKIAESKNDDYEKSRNFWSIYWLQFIMSTIALIFYVLYLIFINQENTVVSTIQMIAIVSCMFDISWLFFGIENFKVTVLRNFVVRVISVFCIFVFVKTQDDLWKYTAIMLGSTLFSQLVLWFNIRRYVRFIKVGVSDIFNHIKPNISLFIPLMAMSIYHVMDKTMLGIFSSDEQSGYYYNSDKIINIPLGILNGVGTVMLPRMSALFKNNKTNEAKSLFSLSLEMMVLLTSAMSFGIAAVAKDFIPIFYGPGFEECINLTYVFAPILIIKSLSVTVRTQLLIPLNRESEFTKSVILGAITNLILNLLLIPRLGAMGAVISTLMAELIACMSQFVSIKNLVNLRITAKNSIIYLLNGMIMFFVVSYVTKHFNSMLTRLGIGILTGFIVFSILTLLFWKFSNNNMINKIIKNRNVKE